MITHIRYAGIPVNNYDRALPFSFCIFAPKAHPQPEADEPLAQPSGGDFFLLTFDLNICP